MVGLSGPGCNPFLVLEMGFPSEQVRSLCLGGSEHIAHKGQDFGLPMHGQVSLDHVRVTVFVFCGCVVTEDAASLSSARVTYFGSCETPPEVCWVGCAGPVGQPLQRNLFIQLLSPLLW